MDRSFLSKSDVVAASRNFVCIRLATYEDKAEAEFMKSIYMGRSGKLENTTFAILSPDGKRKLATAGRGPFHAYRGAWSMAVGMNGISAKYPQAKKAPKSKAFLPLMKNLDLALNVAAADGLPLIITVAANAKQRSNLHTTLQPVAWSKPFEGQFIYASVSDKKQLNAITGIKKSGTILVVEPGQFGMSGKVLAQFESDVKPDFMRSKLRNVIAKLPRKSKNHDSHVRLGIQLGIDWKSKIPETDPMSVRARKRARGQR